MRNKWKVVATITAALAVTGGIVAWRAGRGDAAPVPDDTHEEHVEGEAHADEVTLTAGAIAQNRIVIERARRQALTTRIVAPSRVAFDAERVAHVGSAVSGRVVELHARVGENVHAGDALFAVESAQLGQAQSEFLQRRTESTVAANAVVPSREARARARQLFDETQGIALAEVLKREADERAAVGNAASSLAALRAAEQRLASLGVTADAMARLAETGEISMRFDVRASIDGQVVSRDVTLGELVSPEAEKLVVLADLSRCWVLADVHQSRVADVAIGSEVDVLLGDASAEQIRGTVAMIGAEVDPQTRTAQFRIVVDNPRGTLRPGMFARSLIASKAATSTPVITVREDALLSVEGRTAVFVPVEGEANTFAPRAIEVGLAADGLVTVTAGLRDDEPYVSAGAFILKAELGKSEAGHEH